MKKGVNKLVSAKKGFTLIELLVVVAVIGILASVILLGLSSVRGKGRDARRITDLKQLQNALELYFNACSHYPPALTNLTNPGADCTANIGINQLPTDPSTNVNYGYCMPPGVTNSYVLGAVFEDQNNPILNQQAQNSTNWGCSPVDGASKPMTCIHGETGTAYCVTL